MKNQIKKIKAWWKQFYAKHESEIIISAIQGPGYGIAVCIPPNGLAIWYGVLICCLIITTAWLSAYFIRKYANKPLK